jgi:hypothetical protein
MNKNLLFSKINKGILEERFRIFNRNLEKNLTYIRRFGGLKNIISGFKGKHVIIVGAGSSLGKEIDLLKKYQDRDELITIAADMALLPLNEKNILPKFVISCETTPMDYFSHLNTENMHLLAFSCMSNTNLKKWKGRISFYNWMIHNEMYDNLWLKAGFDLGFVATGSIVTTQAISFALGCGIQSLMLIGNDMGFGTGYYVNGTVVYRKLLNNINRFFPIDTMEINKSRSRREFEIHRGSKIYYTNNQFLAAKVWLEDLFKQINIPIYESNELGCSSGSVKKIALKKYLEHFNKRYIRRR